MCGGEKRPTRTASTTWADRAEKLCCCHSDRPKPLPLLQTTPSISERTHKTRALISYHFTAVKLGDDAGKRRRNRKRDLVKKHSKTGVRRQTRLRFNKAFPALSSVSTQQAAPTYTALPPPYVILTLRSAQVWIAADAQTVRGKWHGCSWKASKSGQ